MPNRRRPPSLRKTLKSTLESIISQNLKDRYYSCLRVSNAEAMQVVAICEQCPSLATSTFKDNITPLSFLIVANASLEVIQSFCQKFPNATKVKWCPPGFSPQVLPLETAINYGYHPGCGVIPCLVELYPNAAHTDLVVRLVHYEDGVMEDIKALLEGILRSGGFQTKEDQENLLHRVWSEDPHPNVLEYLIPKCPRVSQYPILENTCYEPQPGIITKLLPQLVKLDLTVSLELPGRQNFPEALGASHCLEELTLRFGTRLAPVWDDQVPTSVAEWACAAMYTAIGSVPTLKKLWLSKQLDLPKSNDGITAAVVKILGRNTLDSLTLKGFRVDLDVIIAALMQSAAPLRELDIRKDCVELHQRKKILDCLKTENTTLTRLGGHLVVVGGITDQLNYFTLLNKMGRGLARDTSTTATVLVGLLHNANKDGDIAADVTKLGVLYGLLRESPSIWCFN